MSSHVIAPSTCLDPPHFPAADGCDRRRRMPLPPRRDAHFIISSVPPSTIASHRFAAGQTLLFDADDTLWENNIYFERAISAFISYLDHRVHTPEEVREHLNRVERATIEASGYGLKSFRKSLIACFEQLTDKPL